MITTDTATTDRHRRFICLPTVDDDQSDSNLFPSLLSFDIFIFCILSSIQSVSVYVHRPSISTFFIFAVFMISSVDN